MINELSELLAEHSSYTENKKDWTFMSNSYEGGKAYREAGYLTEYDYEVKDTSGALYARRVKETPYNNQCKPIIHLFNSFIFSEAPTVDLNKLESAEGIQDFLEDADKAGRSLNQFMSKVNIVSSVYGHCWIIVDKPAYTPENKQEESDLGLRPYLTLFNPLEVLDWDYTPELDGSLKLSMLKVKEWSNKGITQYKIYKEDVVETYQVEKAKIIDSIAVPNNLGYIPAVISYGTDSSEPGIGISEIKDIAGTNLKIYISTSEEIQLIRLTNHPILVKNESDKVGDGAGAAGVIVMADETINKPFLLQPSATSLDGVQKSIKNDIEHINQQASVGSIRNVESKSAMSGKALETEQRSLAAKLGLMANNLALTIEQVLEMFADWQGVDYDAEVSFPKSFNARDKDRDLLFLKSVLATPISPEVTLEIKKQMVELIVYDAERFAELVKTITINTITDTSSTDNSEIE